MADRRNRHGIGIGNASILLIFIVLTLTVFSVLTLVTAGNEAQTARKFADSSKAYYEAEVKAFNTYEAIAEAADGLFSEELLAEAVEPLCVTCKPDGFGYELFYQTEIDSRRSLQTTLRYENGTLTVTGWKTAGTTDDEYENEISVWDGKDLPFDV